MAIAVIWVLVVAYGSGFLLFFLGFRRTIRNRAPLFFLLVGGAALVAGAGLFGEACLFAARADSATGELVRLGNHRSIPDRRGRTVTTHIPVVRFRPGGDGEPVECRGIGSNVITLRVGDAVPVLYPPNRPEEARLATFGQFWGPAAFFSGAGALTLALAAPGIRPRRSAPPVPAADTPRPLPAPPTDPPPLTAMRRLARPRTAARAKRNKRRLSRADRPPEPLGQS
jgi:hypothetical protein